MQPDARVPSLTQANWSQRSSLCPHAAYLLLRRARVEVGFALGTAASRHSEATDRPLKHIGWGRQFTAIEVKQPGIVAAPHGRMSEQRAGGKREAGGRRPQVELGDGGGWAWVVAWWQGMWQFARKRWVGDQTGIRGGAIAEWLGWVR